MVRGIGTHFYQIIYPVQLRHHEKMGISTREVGTPKVSKRLCINMKMITDGESTRDRPQDVLNRVVEIMG